MWIIAGALAGVVIITVGVLFLMAGDRPTIPGAVPPTTMTTTTGFTATTPTVTVKVYFRRGGAGDPASVAPVERAVPKTEMVATAALRELLVGPTVGERVFGYWSQFSSATAGMLRGVRVDRGVGYADFQDFATVYSFNGDVDAFDEWLQLSPPVGTPGDTAAVDLGRSLVPDLGRGYERPAGWDGMSLG